MFLRQFVLIALVTLTACSAIESEKDVPLSDVPEHIISAAHQAVKGLVLESAELETEDGIENWELEGSANDKQYEIEISTSGDILEIEESS